MIFRFGLQLWLFEAKSMANNRLFQFTAYADVDTYVDFYADLKYRGRVSIFSND